MISKKNQILVFKVMSILIEKKGSRKKMVSIFDIADFLRANKIDAPKIIIEGCLDMLIQHKYVRYYRNEKRYVYYGITELGWKRWDTKVKAEQEAKAQTEVPAEQPKPKRGRPRKNATA